MTDRLFPVVSGGVRKYIMASYTVTNKKRNMDTIQFQVTLIVISVLSSFFVPFIILYPIQEVLFEPNEVWYFEAPFSTYVIFMGAILVTAIILLINVLVEPKKQVKKRIQLGVYISSLLVVLFVLVLCIFNYQYMNASGIYKNKFFSFNEEVTRWDEIIEAKQVFVNNQGVTKDDKYLFTLKDGSVLEVDITNKVRKNKRYIRSILSKNGVILENDYPNK